MFSVRLSDFRFVREPVNVDYLKEQLATFLSRMDGVVQGLPAMMGEFALDSVELSVEVSAKGAVSLLGTSGEASGRGGIKFTLKRRANG